MMGATIFIILLTLILLAAIGTFVLAKRPDDDDGYRRSNPPTRGIAAGVAGVTLLLLIVTIVFSCTTIVGTRQVGIVTKWNKPTGETFDAGLHFILPWTDVHEMDAAIQNDVYNGDKRIQVRLGNNSTALADVNIRWEIKQDQADELFQQYKTFDNVRGNLVERNLRTALNEAFTKFDPLAGDPKEGQPPNATLSTVTSDTLELLKVKSGNQVSILDLSIPVIDYDDNTEQRINAINAARAETTKAEQDAKTAEQRAAASRILANQPVPDLKIAIAACVNRMAETGTNLNCFPIGGNVLPTLEVGRP
jgi:regulator of protease activity HflC (stomatin/prohibitin superfamily)